MSPTPTFVKFMNVSTQRQRSNNMEEYLPFFYIASIVFGAIFGSFACCQAWRIHEKQQNKKLDKRSICMHCNRKLNWYDNIPIISWVILRGKCRFCKQKIGYSEILSEIGLAIIFFLITFKFGIKIETLIILTSLIPYWILLIYDAKWGELPVLLMISVIPFAILYQYFTKGNVTQILISTGLLSGIYYLLYFFSKEKLVGGGDWILCISIAIFLGRFEFVIIELFLSNFTASLAGISQLFKKEKKPIPFGPFLILSMIAILLIKDYLLKFLIIY